MSPEIAIRRIDPSEYPLIKHFLYEAIYVPEGTEAPDREIINLPELSRYYKDFGRDHDNCLVAGFQGKVVAAIWTRLYTQHEPGYGYASDHTPELSMSVLKEYRRKGIGKQLLESMVSILISSGYEQVSLSVDKKNHAYRIYCNAGFVIFREDDKSVIMIKYLKDNA